MSNIPLCERALNNENFMSCMYTAEEDVKYVTEKSMKLLLTISLSILTDSHSKKRSRKERKLETKQAVFLLFQVARRNPSSRSYLLHVP